VPQKVADDDGHRQRQRWRKQSKGSWRKGTCHEESVACSTQF